MPTITPMLIDQHIHGGYGIDFNKCSVEDILFLAKKLFQHGIYGFFPTFVTDEISNIKKQINIIKKASTYQEKESSKILGIHLEGIFINSEKKGIHNSKYFLELTEENFKKIEDDFIKIVTLAPELDKNLIEYLKNKNIKIQAGHCVGGDLAKVQGVTHIYNAMSPINHRKSSTLLSALINDNLYTEIIADNIHVNEDCLKLLFKTKPDEKILLISDALPITYSTLKETIFADSKIYYDGITAKSADGTIAGSTALLDKIVKILCEKGLFKTIYIENVYNYHKIQPQGRIIWDENWNIKDISIEK